MLTRRTTASAAFVVAGALTLSATPSALAAHKRSYDVTITDLTSGQPLTPPVVSTHRGRGTVFQVGEPAIFGVEQIAENGNNPPLIGELKALARVSDVEQAGSDPLVPAARTAATGKPNEVTVRVTADGRTRRLSVVAMLICTNDGFTGVNGLRLPGGKGHSVTVETPGYDAGTEMDTQSFADIVPPCRPLITGGPMEGTATTNPALGEGEVIHHHAGIQAGVGDLDPATFGWRDPVARVKVTRVR